MALLYKKHNSNPQFEHKKKIQTLLNLPVASADTNRGPDAYVTCKVTDRLRHVLLLVYIYCKFGHVSRGQTRKYIF